MCSSSCFRPEKPPSTATVSGCTLQRHARFRGAGASSSILLDSRLPRISSTHGLPVETMRVSTVWLCLCIHLTIPARCHDANPMYNISVEFKDGVRSEMFLNVWHTLFVREKEGCQWCGRLATIEGTEVCWLTVESYARCGLLFHKRRERPVPHLLGPCSSRRTLRPKSHWVNLPSLRVSSAWHCHRIDHCGSTSAPGPLGLHW